MRPLLFTLAVLALAAQTTTPPASVVREGEHYRWGNCCDGWRLVKTDGLSVIRERMPTGTTEVRHRHQRARQFFYVLSGVLSMEVEQTRLVIHPGEGIEVAPGLAHRAFNDGPQPVQFLVTSQPPSRGDRIDLESKPAEKD